MIIPSHALRLQTSSARYSCAWVDHVVGRLIRSHGTAKRADTALAPAIERGQLRGTERRALAWAVVGLRLAQLAYPRKAS